MAKRILIVEDEPDVRVSSRNILERYGYIVQTAANGAQALSIVCQYPPVDLIILDIQMPEMNGYVFINEIKKREGCSSIPIIVVTAYPELQPIFILKGVTTCLLKPVNTEEFMEKIKQYLCEEKA